jgi:hypothetical protein
MVTIRKYRDFHMAIGGVEEFAVLKYGIFSGRFGDDDAAWLEPVEGLEAAYNRVKDIATERPEKYFVFSASTKEPVGSIDTTKQE